MAFIPSITGHDLATSSQTLLGTHICPTSMALRDPPPCRGTYANVIWRHLMLRTEVVFSPTWVAERLLHKFDFKLIVGIKYRGFVWQILCYKNPCWQQNVMSNAFFSSPMRSMTRESCCSLLCTITTRTRCLPTRTCWRMSYGLKKASSWRFASENVF